MKYAKPHRTFDEQLDLVLSRGMDVRNRQQALWALQTIGYYRLSGYWYAWRRAVHGSSGETLRTDDFMPGHAFEDAVALYSFDRRLRLLLLDALERIEVALRVQVSYVAGKAGPLTYLERASHGSNADKTRTGSELTNFEVFLKRNDGLLASSREVFATHVRLHYDARPPIWIATELWDFGVLANFYSLMKPDDQSEVAWSLGVPRKALLKNWVQTLNYTRNLCAHHSRLYRRTLVVKPGQRSMSHIPELAHIRNLSPELADKLYPVLCIVLFLMDQVAPGSQWAQSLLALLEDFPREINASLANYGFPDNWPALDIWSRG